MNKIKCHLCAALTVVLLFSALGCSAPDSGNAGKSDAATQNLDSVGGRETVGYILPDIADGYWEIFDGRCNVVYEPGFSAMCGIDLTMLSAVPMEQTDITVTTAAGWDMIYYLDPYYGEDGMYQMSEDVFLLYQGVSAEDLLDYQAGTISAERKAEINEWILAYRALDDSEKPTIYRYKLDLCIPVTEMDSNAVLDELTVTVHGETRTYQLGTIRNLMEESTEYVYDPDYSLNCDDNIGYFGFPVDVSSDGRIFLDNIKYTAVDDVVITGIRFYNAEEVQIQSVSVVQSMADGAVIDTAWDMLQPIELNAGDSIFLNIQITDSFFAGTLGGWSARYLMLEYRSNGETFELGIPFHFVQTLSDPFAYIAAKDEADVLTYYSR